MNIPFTQTKEYLSWHESVGEKTFYKEFFDLLDEDTGEEIEFQIADLNDREKETYKKKNLKAIVASIIINLRIGKVLYVPYGPYFPLLCKEGLGEVEKKEIINYLYDLAKKENCVFVRIEDAGNKKDTALWGDEQNIYPAGQNLFYFHPPKKSFAKEGIFQPRVEWWLDIQKEENELYENIHKDHRYSIRRAQKENIETEIATENLESYFAIFWKILKETSERDGFHLYTEKYYRAIFENKENGLKKFLVFTKQGNQYLSVALVVVSDKVANLIFAGSVSEKRELGFNHLMQWEAIKKSKEIGCQVYNFGGIYENGYGKPSLEGVTKFKKRFGGYSHFHGDFIDIQINKIIYFLYIIRKLF